MPFYCFKSVHILYLLTHKISSHQIHQTRDLSPSHTKQSALLWRTFVFERNQVCTSVINVTLHEASTLSLHSPDLDPAIQRHTPDLTLEALHGFALFVFGLSALMVLGLPQKKMMHVQGSTMYIIYHII